MLHYNRINVSEDIDYYKTSASKECTFFVTIVFLDKRFMFSSSTCSSCHNVLIMSTEIKNIDILNIDGVDYCYILLKLVKLKPSIY